MNPHTPRRPSFTARLLLAALTLGPCSVTACRSAVKDFYDPLLVPPCEGGAAGQTTSQAGSAPNTTSTGTGGAAAAGGQCAAP